MKPGKRPTKLQCALRAFWSIMKERPHVFCDEKIRSTIGNSDEVSNFQNNITDMFNNEVLQNRILQEAKDILKR